MQGIQSRFLFVDGVKTHYLEAGDGPTLILLHSGEFGACGEITWEFNLPALAKHFHVFAPDWLGFGRSAKIFSFEDMWQMRVQHIRRFMATLGIEHAHFMGNSMGGSTLLTVAATAPVAWPIDKIVVVSGGGRAPENEARQLLNSYDCTREHMRKIVRTVFMRAEIRDSEAYVEKRYRATLEPGAWECTAAARFTSPISKPQEHRRPASYGDVAVPALLIAGAHDNLRMPNFAQELKKQIPNAVLQMFPEAGHCPQIDAPEEFNRVVIDFLLE